MQNHIYLAAYAGLGVAYVILYLSAKGRVSSVLGMIGCGLIAAVRYFWIQDLSEFSLGLAQLVLGSMEVVALVLLAVSVAFLPMPEHSVAKTVGIVGLGYNAIIAFAWMVLGIMVSKATTYPRQTVDVLTRFSEWPCVFADILFVIPFASMFARAIGGRDQNFLSGSGPDDSLLDVTRVFNQQERNTKMKKIIIAFAVVAVSFGAFARGRGCGGGWGGGCRPCGPVCRPCRPVCHPCRPICPPCYRDGWGRGGRNFWPGFVGGVVGGLVCNTIAAQNTVVVQQPTVVTQPVVTQPVIVQQPVVTAPVTQTQNVWVEGRYVDQVQANGSVVRVWSPGHYEQRTVTL